jgi:hypothetical protein
MAFEYDRIKRFTAMKIEFIYFFNCSIVLGIINTEGEIFGACGSSIGPTLLVCCCVKAISTHSITGI